MRILLLGVTGMLGNDIYRVFSESDHMKFGLHYALKVGNAIFLLIISIICLRLHGENTLF